MPITTLALCATLAALLVLVVLRLRQGETAQRVAAIVDAADDGIIATSLDWVISAWNPAAERIYGYPGSEVIGRSAGFLFPPELAHEMRTLKDQLAAGEPIRDYETVRVRKDGTRIHVALTMSMIRGRRRVPSGALVIVRDLTAARRATDALRAFALRVETMQECERAAIAREVHDAVGQGLTVLRMSASRLATMSRANPDTSALIAQMTTVIDDTLRSTRCIAMALHPSALDDLGLGAAIEIHVAHVARSANLEAVVVTDPTPRNIPQAHAATAYRVLQESLTNVIRHAQATEVKVQLSTTATELVLQVTDDGRGFVASDLPAASSLGLLGMRERAHILGGVLHVASAAPRGTSVSLRLPLP